MSVRDILHNNHDECDRCSINIGNKSIYRKQLLIIISSGILLALGLYTEFILKNYFLAEILFLIVVGISGYSIILKAFKLLIRKKISINLLITIATIGAFLIDHGEEGAAVMFLFYIAEFLEEYAAERARRSIASLLKLAPEVAKVKKGDKIVTLHVHEVNVGDIIVVKPGDKIPLDGIVVKGYSTVNQAPITGESIPVVKTVGDFVYAGTINEEGYLEIKVTRKSNETLLSKIVRLVEEAQRKKSRTEIFINRFAKYYTPLIIILALLVMFIPTLIFKLPFEEWFYRGLVLLVVACPCALAISTPVSMVSAITSAARNGVLIKGGNYVEEIGKASTFVFDKTGTLTKGTLKVHNVITFNNFNADELVRIAASLEMKSNHPIAKAIVEYAKEKNLKLYNVYEFKSYTGKGITGYIDGELYLIGNKTLFEEMNIEIPTNIVDEVKKRGETVVFVGNRNTLLGAILLADTIREHAFELIRELKKNKIKTVMLTGDNKTVAEVVAKKLGIDEYYYELLPEDKVRIVENLTKRYGNVVMVGDGINDAPALAKANVGIAMGHTGTDIAIESADIVLMHDELLKINYLIKLSKKTMQIIKQNITASITIKGSLGLLALFGKTSLWLAVAIGDMGLSLAVILNALRLGRIRSY